jgi:hypothetical protein
MPAERLNLRIELDADADAGAEERDEAARALRSDLLDLDVDSVERPETAAPDGSRGAGAVEIGTLLVTVGQHALGLVATTIAAWVQRRGGRSATLELDGDRIDLKGVSKDDQHRLIEAFLARHVEA